MNYPLQRSSDISRAPCPPPRFLILSSSPCLVRDDASCRFVFDSDSHFDGIVVLDGQGTEKVQAIVRQSNNRLLPVANLSGGPLAFADFHANEQGPETIDEAVEELSRTVRLIQSLPDDVRFSNAPETILLARAYSRSRVLEPVYDPSARDCVIYPVAGLVQEPGSCAERLTNAGYFTRMFFDRLHACPDCGSSRLNAREECVACRSADLANEALIHHVRCGHRALETEFREQDLLICPNCRKELRLRGMDHERPGVVNVCRSCGHADGQTSVGFVCIDCKARHDSEAVATRDFYKYQLTQKGERALLTNQLSEWRDRRETGPSPEEAMIRQALRLHARYGRPLTILKIALGHESTTAERDGKDSLARAWARVHELTRSETRDTDVVIEAANEFLVYMPETDDCGAVAPRARLLEMIGSSVPLGFNVEITALHPDDLGPASRRP